MAYHLQNDRLSVKIAELGEAYRGTRFDGSGIITGIELNGRHQFCVPESLTPGTGTGGIGLCSEFGIKEAIGYEDARVGELFPKLGVGLLTRPDEAEYRFYREYACRQFETEIEQKSAQQICFTTQPAECRGYAVRMLKNIEISGNQLFVTYTVENTGNRAILTDEYSHNFLGIDGYAVGPDYVLKLPFVPEIWSDEPETLEGIEFKGDHVTWERRPEKDFYFRMDHFDGRAVPWLWELTHHPSGLIVRELSKLPLSSAAVWGHGHVISPEMFFAVHVAPGERQSWTRIYEFSIE
ncbi:hypothetical protein IM700_018640 [Paenibacillus sp. DXFW5]|uniref:Uncharacterized protein n=1 Tax=Paenibacillus rhizolycopersici TaxID=2780073 RepID=A0ABS2HDM2_9BACL|nr:hypothetical protein [Paenibacillus rhizolycopersici]MBM6997684.1 hypothetical protein [Paenibacillus rhizolycopersici]